MQEIAEPSGGVQGTPGEGLALDEAEGDALGVADGEALGDALPQEAFSSTVKSSKRLVRAVK